MSVKPVPPALSLASFSCPHCGAHAQQTWYEFFGAWRASLPPPPATTSADLLLKALGADATQITPPVVEVVFGAQGSNSIKERAHVTHNLHASGCHACRRIAIWVGSRIVHPPAKLGPLPNADLPADIRQDYEEAQAILNLSPRGAAALLRLAIQKLCKHLGGKGKNIDADIAALVKKGLSVQVQQALDIVRVVGNESVHPGELDLRDDQDTALKLLGMVNMIADRLISEPKNVAALFESLPEGKRTAIEKRDKKS